MSAGSITDGVTLSSSELIVFAGGQRGDGAAEEKKHYIPPFHLELPQSVHLTSVPPCSPASESLKHSYLETDGPSYIKAINHERLRAGNFTMWFIAVRKYGEKYARAQQLGLSLKQRNK